MYNYTPVRERACFAHHHQDVLSVIGIYLRSSWVRERMREPN